MLRVTKPCSSRRGRSSRLVNAEDGKVTKVFKPGAEVPPATASHAVNPYSASGRRANAADAQSAGGAGARRVIKRNDWSESSGVSKGSPKRSNDLAEINRLKRSRQRSGHNNRPKRPRPLRRSSVIAQFGFSDKIPTTDFAAAARKLGVRLQLLCFSVGEAACSRRWGGPPRRTERQPFRLGADRGQTCPPKDELDYPIAVRSARWLTTANCSQ